MSTATDTLIKDELHVSRIGLGIHEGDLRFAMTEIEVDGIYGRRATTSGLYDKYFMSLKDEQFDDGSPADTGFEYHHNPNLVVSDTHWMSCAAVVGAGDRCPECEEIADA